MGTPEHKDEQLDRMLAKGRFKRPEQERILQNVLGTVHSEEPKKPSWIFSLRFAPVVLSLLLILPGAWYLTQEKGFRTKGGPSTGPSIQAACTDTCTLGDKVLFQIKGLKQTVFFAAYATTPAGERMIWYFPTPSGKAISVTPKDEWTVLPQGVRIGPEHGSGVHTVHLLLLVQPLDRNSLRSALETPNSPLILVWKKQLLEIR